MDIKTIDKFMKETQNTVENTVKWYDLKNDYLRGLAFKNGFNRLPHEAFISEHVEVLSAHPSGINITFRTNSPYIKIRAELNGASYMAHMTAVGQIGFDLYYKDNNHYQFVATTKINQTPYELTMLDGLEKNDKEFRLYFPLYQGLKNAFIGVDTSSTFSFVKNDQPKVVIYGTSISQGGCASRPGMSYSNILDRMTDYEFINLGFSGSAHLELPMAHLINQIEKKCLILEVEANNTTNSLEEKLLPFINTLNDGKIILITHFPYSMSLLKKDIEKELQYNYQLQMKMPKVTILNGRELFSDLSYDETVDGIHLTDLGFYHLALKLKNYL